MTIVKLFYSSFQSFFMKNMYKNFIGRRVKEADELRLIKEINTQELSRHSSTSSIVGYEVAEGLRNGSGDVRNELKQERAIHKKLHPSMYRKIKNRECRCGCWTWLKI